MEHNRNFRQNYLMKWKIYYYLFQIRSIIFKKKSKILLWESIKCLNLRREISSND